MTTIEDLISGKEKLPIPKDKKSLPIKKKPTRFIPNGDEDEYEDSRITKAKLLMEIADRLAEYIVKHQEHSIAGIAFLDILKSISNKFMK